MVIAIGFAMVVDLPTADLVRGSMFNVQCSMFNGQRSMFNVQCSMVNVQCSMVNGQRDFKKMTISFMFLNESCNFVW